VITAPVRDDAGHVVAVVTVTVPRAQITPQEIAGGLVEKVKAAADELSSRLNYRPDTDAPSPKYLKSLGLK
jgi:DNA-binding IclR family transcriptional regulator